MSRNKRPIYFFLSTISLTALLWVLALYRATLSPDHGLLRGLFPGGVCRFTPTCSQYMSRAVKLHGWAGLWLGLQRLGRCHPFTTGGIDYPPAGVATSLNTGRHPAKR
ncbi:MAG: membrane protein insertion efficiency factor YidD [Candidatus Andersenbacteria bacterium]